MLRLLNWFGVLQFIAAPVFTVASLWVSELKFLWIGFFLLLSSIITSAFAQALRKQSVNNDATLF